MGSPGGPTASGAVQYRESNLGDALGSFARLGHALAFGRFDDTGRANLAAGAPGKENNTGQVYVIAPWRQVANLPCRNSIAVDCDDEIVFSQKPFEKVYIASTTKIMTVLLACERIQLPDNDPDHVDAGALYLIDPWMTGQFPPTSNCSIFGFVTGEKMSLLNMMRVCIAVSGNDAAVGIADVLTGSQVNSWNGYTGTTTEFVDEMNQRALELGMFSTNFTNAPGIDSGDPMSTAYDMYLLTREAMKNPLFADIAGTEEWFLLRDLPGGSPNDIVTPTQVVNGFYKNILNQVSTATGAKGGNTPKANRTGCFTARSSTFPWGTAVVTTFGTPQGMPLYTPAGNLLSLALGECDPSFLVPLPVPKPKPWVVTGLSAAAGAGFKVHTKLEEEESDDVVIEVQVANHVSAAVEAELRIEHSSSIVLEPGQSATYGVSAFESHDGISILNQSETASATLSITATHPVGFSATYALAPGQQADLAPADVDDCVCLLLGAVDYRMILTNAGTETACVGVAERGYRFDVSLTTGAAGPAPPGTSLMARELLQQPASWTQTVGATLFDVQGGPADELVLVGRDPDVAFSYDPCDPDWRNYGPGWPGTLGVPILELDVLPVMGNTVHVEVGNSAGVAVPGLIVVGSFPVELPSGSGGTILANLETLLPVSVPADGLSAPWSLPFNPALCGSRVYAQAVTFDPAASHLFSFSRGLEVIFGLPDPQ